MAAPLLLLDRENKQIWNRHTTLGKQRTDKVAPEVDRDNLLWNR